MNSPGSCWICNRRPAGSGICTECNAATLPYAEAWQLLSAHLHRHWDEITARGQFDLSKIHLWDSTRSAVDVQLHFVKLLAGKLHDAGLAVNLASFAAAVLGRTPHPEVTLLVASSRVKERQLLSYAADVSVLRDGDEVQSALWTHLAHPVAIKICYLKTGAPVRTPPEAHPWHPLRQRKIVKLSPYKGDTQPVVARRDLRI